MKLETKFDLGEEVWHTKSKVKEIVLNPCKYCNGEGKVELKNDDKIVCPRCYGTKGTQKTLYLIEPNTNMSKIGQVRVEVGKDNIGISYMLFATGVGSGISHPEERIFKTKEDGQKYCDDKNKIREDKFWKENVKTAQ